MQPNPNDEAFISVDVETAGSNPGQYSLLSIGACSVMHPEHQFYVELVPENDEMLPETFAIHKLSIKELKSTGIPPHEAMSRFATWLDQVVPGNQQPIFVAFNAPFDWMFVSDYFHRYLGYNPFGHAALDIKAYYMGLHGSAWNDTGLDNVTMQYLGGKKISHNALEDACDQAQIFSRMYHRAGNRA